MKVRVQVDFVVDTDDKTLPQFDVLDFVMAGLNRVMPKATAIYPGARFSLRRLDRVRGTRGAKP